MPGLPIVFAPGLMCDARLFAPQIAGLARDHDVLVADFSRDDTIALMAQRLLAAAPPLFYLAGLSMGGIVALEAMRLESRRIAGLALLDTTCRADAADKRRVREAQMARARDGDLARLVASELKPTYLAARTKSDKALVAGIIAMADDLGPEVFIRQSRALMERRDNTDFLAHINCPVEIVCGSEDTLCPPAIHRFMADEIKGARLTIAPSCGHLTSLEAPEIVTAILAAGLKAAGRRVDGRAG